MQAFYDFLVGVIASFFCWLITIMQDISNELPLHVVGWSVDLKASFCLRGYLSR